VPHEMLVSGRDKSRQLDILIRPACDPTDTHNSHNESKGQGQVTKRQTRRARWLDDMSHVGGQLA